ncbi:unnamed protein product [Camellia sinensis]
MIGLRWRTEKEVVSGKGQFEVEIQNVKCAIGESEVYYFTPSSGLQMMMSSTNYHYPGVGVNFSYFEAGENKQALVKLVTCERERSESGDGTDTGYGRSKKRKKDKGRLQLQQVITRVRAMTTKTLTSFLRECFLDYIKAGMSVYFCTSKYVLLEV